MKWAFGCNVKQPSPGVLLFSAWYATQVKVKGWEPKNGLRSGFLFRPGGFAASKLSFFLWCLCPSPPLYIKWYIVYPSGRVTVVMFHVVPWSVLLLDSSLSLGGLWNYFQSVCLRISIPVPLGCFFFSIPPFLKDLHISQRWTEPLYLIGLNSCNSLLRDIVRYKHCIST